MSVAIVKYNAGNVFSVMCAMKRIGVEALVTDDPDALRRDRAVQSAPKAPVRPLPAEKRQTPATPATAGHYKPKPGVNKSSRSLHVDASVNAAHRGR